MSNPSPQKLRAISIMFLVAGAWGLAMGMFYFKNPSFPLAALGVINLVLGIFLGFRQMQKRDSGMYRKKK
ncbi:hypothetical protein DYY67_1352 [Candidatus Nitrosotalea sp. TS]|uniref:hypothetical protein n=1 Tax=Candidatus Nitrosotalea sp. TS TaxID=2341020 RepID=UPI00140CA51A|nr:hypothetical protein [Candidatus Nitrosotalea sp. TS]MDE1826707.1 hypothetical protein [Nitrososphaerota archaeon]MDE1872486.1 hypothetical protein [Nitrososphaerota archaeon]NHI03557.1 hypothetical protein [Candidatus Nitrosotalea sp. TS]